MQRSKRVLAFGVLIVVVAGGSLFLSQNASRPTREVQQDNPEIKEIVQKYSAWKDASESASITSHQLIVSDGGKEVVYDLPEREFFVSIAPYKQDTHPCQIHSLTGCQGELTNEEFNVRIADSNGNIVLDEVKMSGSNGFIDLWLPRDQQYQVIIEQDGKKAESTLSTYKNDNTCITTMQLV